MTRPVEQLVNGALIVRLELPAVGFGIADGAGVVRGIRRTIEEARAFAATLPAAWPDGPLESTLSWSHRAQGRVRELGPAGSRARDREQG